MDQAELAAPETLAPQVRLAVLQPTSFCNLDCEYCYVPDRQNTSKMSFGLMEDAFRRLLESPFVSEELEILWHAGEPLTVGLQFYREALRLQRRIFGDKVRITNNIQTNATLLDSEWCRFLKDNSVRVSVSIDGPAELHDRTRRFRGGRGSFAKVMSGIRALRDHEIDFGVLMVLTRHHLQEPHAIFDFMVQNRFDWIGFNVEEREGENKSGLDPVVDRQDYYRFFTEFYDVWEASDRPFVVREFQDFHATLLRTASGGTFFRQPDETLPFAIVTIGRTGEIYTFSPELASTTSARYGSFSLGNVRTDPIDGTLLKNRPDIVREVREGIDACRRTCEYFRFCGGAYVSNRATEHDDLRVPATNACSLHRKLLFEIVLSGLEKRRRSLHPGRTLCD